IRMASISTGTLTDQWLVVDSVSGDPFEALDEFLAGHGFGVWSEPFVPAADGLVADLYLGYRLAAALPGVSSQAPPEPCRLPALFLRRRGDVVETMPIKGTRPADDPERIAENPKDRAEHVMIVDLERNDLARVCVPHSVHVPDFLIERPMAGVRHLVSRVQGRLALGVGLAELLRATFPGGSITGAPKVSAINHIARLEPVGRGASMGAL